MAKQSVQEMCEQHFNEPVISHLEVVRLIGYGETAVDCYLISSSVSQGVVWLSAVGGCIFLDRLKGQGYIRSTEGENWDDFIRLDSWLELNGAPRVKDFIVDLRPDDHEGCELVGGAP